MPNQRNTNAKARHKTPQQNRAMSNVVSGQFPTQTPAFLLDRGLMLRLKEAALCHDRFACKNALTDALANGIAPEDLADHYIPELAREMGEQWCSDQMGFAAVTIGVSRLQSMLRDLGPGWSGDVCANPNAPAVMLIVPQDVYHTLGAMVLGSQLRRKGLSVRLMLGAPYEELAIQLSATNYQAVFISASIGETFESLRKIVDVIKASARNQLPIVLGGTILEQETDTDVRTLTGADFATKVSDEALEYCGLTKKLQNIPQSMRGS